MNRTLAPETLAFLSKTAELAAEHGWSIYLVGGYVRDIFLARPHYDLDIAVQGDAIALANELHLRGDARLEATHRFGTAYLAFDDGKHELDLVTARSETYAFPGALPTVQPGDILADLARRDFTINAMAIGVTPGGSGPLIDPHGGLRDAQARLVRVLHPGSFIDDPTRIPRAVKYALRLGFEIEPETLELIFQAVRDGALATVSTDRIVHELLLIMEEHNAGVMLAMLERLGVLRAIHPFLAWPYPPDSKFGPTDDGHLRPHERRDAYLAILAAEFAGDPADAEGLARSLGLGAHLARLMHDAARLAHIWPQLGQGGMPPSAVYHLLAGMDMAALRAYTQISAMAADSIAWGRLHEYLERLRHVKPELGGDYLRELGIKPGPIYRRVLDALLEAKVDGAVPLREDEERFVKNWLSREALIEGG